MKAPGQDDLPPLFLPKNWEIIKDVVVAFVNEAFAYGEFPPFMNEALISLIPKKDQPDEMASFRPIASCNVTSKAITKIIANRIKPLMSKLVAEN